MELEQVIPTSDTMSAAQAKRTGFQNTAAYGEECFQRVTAKLAGVTTAEAGLEGFLFSAFDGLTPVPISASTDHVVAYFIECGCSKEDFGNALGRIVYSLTTGKSQLLITVRSWDLYTWLLDLTDIELCGQKITITRAGRLPTKSFFMDPTRSNVNGINEAQFLENLACVKQYLPIGTKKDAPSEVVSTKVFSWGDGKSSIPKLCDWVGGRVVTQASCGERHAAFLTDTGQVFTSGDSSQGQLGNGQSWNTIESYEVKFPADVVIRQIACGNTYTLALTETNNVMYFGTCKYTVPTGPFNIPKQTVLFKEHRPTLWEDLKRDHITQIASGAAHILLLRLDGTVLSVGSSAGGRLGRPKDDHDHKFPLPVPALSGKIVFKIACGYKCSMARSRSGIFVWGSIRDYAEDPHNYVPKVFEGLAKSVVIDVAWGYESGHVLADTGLYEFRGTSYKKINTPYPLVSLSAGFRHTLGLGPAGEVYSWGASEEGQCGHGDAFRYEFPTRVRHLPPVGGIAASGSISLAFTGLRRSALSKDFEKAVNNPDSFPDIAFQVGDVKIYAHRAMLIARCHQLRILDLILAASSGTLTQAASAKSDPNCEKWRLVTLEPTNNSRAIWPDGLIPTDPNPISTASSSYLTSDDLSTIPVIPYSTTRDGKTKVTEKALLAVLFYIYADVIEGENVEDRNAIAGVALDFGLPRLRALLYNFDTSPESTYVEDLDCLIATPSEFVVTTDVEKLALEWKKQSKALISAFSDLTLTAADGGASIAVHRFILVTRSEFFKTLLSSGMSEAKERHITLQTDESTCRWLLRFLYTDRPCNSDINITVELLKIGAMLDLHRLVFVCSRAIEKELDDETTAYMYHLTHSHNIPILRDLCWSIICGKFSTIQKTDYWKNNLSEEERAEWQAKLQKPAESK